jgi:chorismate mutase/acetolactate synthase regulatory subunit
MESEYMTLEEVRGRIDALDPGIRDLLMERMDLSCHVAEAKKESGDFRVYRPDREEEILKRLGQGVEEARKAPYLAVVRKIMETSRMYQYGIMYDHLEDPFGPLSRELAMPERSNRVRVCLTRENRPNAMSSILSMIGDYGFNMEQMELIREDAERQTVTFELVIIGDLHETRMKKLMFQLSKESMDFRILSCYRADSVKGHSRTES